MPEECSKIADVEIDVGAVTRRYEEERRKRLRADTVDQFVHLEGRFADFARDPHADPNFTRAPLTDEVEVVVMGGGIAGLLAAARLRDEGVQSLKVIDRAADFGGTWYWNRYPGVRCDVESYVYMPMLEETGYIPTEKYATGAEILDHCRRIARHHRLYDGALFQTAVTGMDWDAAARRWRIATDRGDSIAARFVVCAKGIMSTAKLPRVPGIETFEGHSFHTSRWDYAYTGGGPGDFRLRGLADKTVGVIGTGATAIQCVPPLGAWAKQLHVFQRTPSSIDVRGNRPTDPAWAASLEPGWGRKRTWNFTALMSGVPQAEDMVSDGWTELMWEQMNVEGGLDPAQIHLAQLKKMERLRRRIDAIVEDRATAEALKPYYHLLCKRPGFSDEYLQTFNRPNVTLVDTAGRGVEAITPRGVVAGGREYPLDCLIFATGFDVLVDYNRELGFEVAGRGGRKLSEHWGGGMRTLFGTQTHDFPNFFIMGVLQAAGANNYTHIVGGQAEHIGYVVGRAIREGAAVVEPTPEAVEAWVGEILSGAAGRRAFLDSCTPGYLDLEGRRDASFDLNAIYPAGPVPYFEALQRWRADGAMQGLVLEPES